MHAALDFAAGDPDRVALVLQTTGSMEKSLGHPEFALKLLQMGQVAANTSTDPQNRAVIGGETVEGYVASGRPDMAKKNSRLQEACLPMLIFPDHYPGLLHTVMAMVFWHRLSLSWETPGAARQEILTALRKRPKNDTWCNALDTIILATTNMRAGEVREGVQDTQRALTLVKQVGSWQLQERLMPLADELNRCNDSTCQDLARTVRQFRIAV